MKHSKLFGVFVTVFLLKVLLSLPGDTTDTTDTIIPIIEPIVDEEYNDQQQEMIYFLYEIMDAFDIQIPNDSIK